MTVRGPVSSADLGFVLPHEHVLIDLSRAPFRWDFEGLLDDPVVAIDELSALHGVGKASLVDVTTPDLGRNPRLLAEISTAAKIDIVMGCGWYREPYLPEWIDRTTTTALANKLISEIQDGADGTEIRPGVIGEVGSDKRWVSPREERVLRAAARAQSSTGLGLMTHTPPGGALEQLEILADAGADLRRVAIGHADSRMDDEYHQAILKTGAWASFDLVGQKLYPDPRRAQRIASLVSQGWIDHLLLSMDLCHRSRLKAWGGPGYSYLHETFVPLLITCGLSMDQVKRLTETNPARFLDPSAES